MSKINLRLAQQMGLSEEAIKDIKELYKEEESICNEMKQTDIPEELQGLAERWHDVHFFLQKKWGFKENKAYHKWWYLPKCTCPKMDNDDVWPTGYYIMTVNCPIHGWSQK